LHAVEDAFPQECAAFNQRNEPVNPSASAYVGAMRANVSTGLAGS
jgi:hypothetical protein